MYVRADRALTRIEIWAPRYKDRKVLIAKTKVGAHNEIVFTKVKHLPGSYYMSGLDIQSYPLGTNGKIPCYEVPLDKLDRLERL